MAKRKEQKLPSSKYIKITCPYCKEDFAWITHDGPDRHEYVVDLRGVNMVECPHCAEEMEVDFDTTFGFVKN